MKKILVSVLLGMALILTAIPNPQIIPTNTTARATINTDPVLPPPIYIF